MNTVCALIILVGGWLLLMVGLLSELSEGTRILLCVVGSLAVIVALCMKALTRMWRQ